MCTCYPHLSLHKKHLAQLSDHFSISSLSMLAVIDHVLIWSITASGLAKNEDGKKALRKQLPKELIAEVKWSHVACKEAVLFTFFDHGNMRDCFKGSSFAERETNGTSCSWRVLVLSKVRACYFSASVVVGFDLDAILLLALHVNVSS